MAGRKVRTAEEARAVLEQAAAHGVDWAEWARREGIDGRSLNAWRLNLARRRPPSGLRLVEVVPTATPVPGAAPVVVRCGPFAVEVGGDFDDQVLRRVLAVVAAC